jgi:hypothetical protein
VVDFDANGVYFMTWCGDSYGSGVSLLNPATGDVRVLTNTADVLKVRGGFTWVGRLDPRDPSPPGGVANRRLYNSIVRLDLKSGAEVIWYDNAGSCR